MRNRFIVKKSPLRYEDGYRVVFKKKGQEGYSVIARRLLRADAKNLSDALNVALSSWKIHSISLKTLSEHMKALEGKPYRENLGCL